MLAANDQRSMRALPDGSLIADGCHLSVSAVAAA